MTRFLIQVLGVDQLDAIIDGDIPTQGIDEQLVVDVFLSPLDAEG